MQDKQFPYFYSSDLKLKLSTFTLTVKVAHTMIISLVYIQPIILPEIKMRMSLITVFQNLSGQELDLSMNVPF